MPIGRVDGIRLDRRPASVDLLHHPDAATRRLVLHTLMVDDRDYAPLLSLPNLEAVRVVDARGMTPPHDELVRQLPWEG